MAFPGEYKCSECGKIEKPELLTVKKIAFQTLGRGPRTLKSRNVGWYCPLCVSRDPDWNREAYVSPGMQPAQTNRRSS